MKAVFLVSALLVLSLTCASPAQLSGNYTIDPAGSGSRNYTTWAAAVSALGAGVSGPVVFTVASTTFNGAVTINPVKGASATATVTFQAAGSPAILDAGAAQDGLTLNAACSYLIFDNIEVRNVTRYALHVAGPSSTKATFCTLKNCKFDAPATSSSSSRAALLNYCNDMTFENCVFAGGGYGTYWQQINRCTFKGCEFDGKNTSNYLIAPFNSNDANNLFENCFFHDCGPTGRGLYFNWSSYGNLFFHNTIIMNTSREAVFMGSCCAWSRCCVWRNNIIVNMGTGWAATYGLNGAVLDYNDLDNNCYFVPNATNGTLRTDNNTFTGTLAQWKTYFAANPNLIPAGGGTNWDQNSIEADPQLVSMTAPYDIHLKAGSPCLDGGTTTYIAGSWVSYNASYVTATDFEGEARPTTNVDIGADEVSVRLVGSGSGKPGTAITLNLYAPADVSLPYQLGSSLGNGPIPVDTRFLYLSPDPLLVASVNGYLPTIFVNYSGFLDTSGQATAALAIPNVPALTGIRIYTAFVTVKAGAPSNLQSISGTFLFTVM
jgi:parallel beta helix pectate lyase-like protein